MEHCALTGSACFDLYVRDETGKERFVDSFKRKVSNRFGYEAVIRLPYREMREYTINFPTYSSVDSLYVGLDENAKLEAPGKYRVETPVVFYGSSITQGGCASRPGSTYQAVASRRLDFDYVNLGFSGNAKGEQVMADYIAGLPMSVFVCDYDHNAPTVEHLWATHENLYRTVRKAHPDIPVIFMARPLFTPGEDALARLEVIKATYEKAKAAGENVYLIDGPTLMAMAGDDGLVDGAHPNDLGFASMAKAVGDVLAEIL
jgi:lysophospholipase L1-like esterase